MAAGRASVWGEHGGSGARTGRMERGAPTRRAAGRGKRLSTSGQERDKIKVYEVGDDPDTSVFLWRPGDLFAIEDVQFADHQGMEAFLNTARTWLSYPEVSGQDLSHPSDVYEQLFPDESLRGMTGPGSMSAGLLRGIGAREVACYDGATDRVDVVVGDPLPATRRYLGLPDP